MFSCQAQRRTVELPLEASLHPADHLAMTLLVYCKGGQGHCTTSLYTMSNRTSSTSSVDFDRIQINYSVVNTMSSGRSLSATAHNARKALIANDLGHWDTGNTGASLSNVSE